VVEIVGEGRDWASRTYVRMATELFDRGIVQCLVGTRGILGEGWDSLSLNTLIDLTSVTTSTSVQQLRGRTIRKDPAWGRKVAHNWDVVCIARNFERGNLDLRRFTARHDKYWGIVIVPAIKQLMADIGAATDALITQLPIYSELSHENSYLPPEQNGRVVKGLMHVDPELAYDMIMKPFKRINFAHYTRRMLATIPERDKVYDLWRVGEEYSNFSYSASRIDTRDLTIRTVFSVKETIKRMLREFIATLLGSILVALVFSLDVSARFAYKGTEILMIVLKPILLISVFVTFLFNLRNSYRIFQKFMVNQPVDAILLDVARALFFSLRENGLISRNLQPEYLRVVEQPNNSYEILLDYASPEDAATFIKAFGEIFAPVRDQRYLILRTDERLPNILLTPFWLALRNFLKENLYTRPTFHPVPQILATRKELAEVFAKHWKQYVGGGLLIFTRSEAGRSVLFQARAQHRPKVKGLAFEIWR
jgi:hypothetical protein